MSSISNHNSSTACYLHSVQQMGPVTEADRKWRLAPYLASEWKVNSIP
jgi:hypothetical protein